MVASLDFHLMRFAIQGSRNTISDVADVGECLRHAVDLDRCNRPAVKRSVTFY
jgi:hypothetical protein